MDIKKYLEERSSKCKTRLDEIDKALDEAEKKNESSQDETELKALGDSLAELEAEKAELEAELKEVQAQIDALNKPEGKPEEEEKPKEEVEVIVKPNERKRPFLNYEVRGGNKEMDIQKNEIEERTKKAEEFVKTRKFEKTTMETRAVLVSSGDIAQPTEVNGINPNFQQVSSIVDLVKVRDCNGMGGNKVAYLKAIGEADDQTEGEEITESDPEYDYVEITPENVAIISYISNEVMETTPLNYEGAVVDSAEKALRVKIAKFITNKVKSSALLSKPAKLKISEIDDKTLRNIALMYGSDETVMGNAWLFLSKKDLIAFGDIRSDTTLQAVYEITPDNGNPNTGVIKDGGLSVRYCLDSNLTALEDADANGISMLYCIPECIELDLFSGYKVKVSEDAKFAEDMLAIRGTVRAGADITHYEGVIAVTKADS